MARVVAPAEPNNIASSEIAGGAGFLGSRARHYVTKRTEKNPFKLALDIIIPLAAFASSMDRLTGLFRSSLSAGRLRRWW